MKRILLAIFMFALMCSSAYASPFLTCDPVPGATYFLITLDGVERNIPAGEGGSLRWDLNTVPLATGNHTLTGKSCNEWGCSISSAPFSFTKSIPGPPTTISIKAQ